MAFEDQAKALFLLTDRTQFVSSSGIKSTNLPVTFGVRQGPILEPLLFLLYINDLHNGISCTPHVFADDTCLFVSSNKLSSLETYMNSDLDKFRGWVIVQNNNLIFILSSAPLKSLMRIAVDLKRNFEELAG